MICLDSFSGAASDLKGDQRTPDAVLRVLRTKPRVSCFDMSEPYPWVRYIITAQEEGQ